MISRVRLLIEAVDCSRMTSCVEGCSGETLKVPLKDGRKVPASALGRDLDLFVQVVEGSTLEEAHHRGCGCGPLKGLIYSVGEFSRIQVPNVKTYVFYVTSSEISASELKK